MDDGVRLRTWTHGIETDLPPVLLLHGGPGLWDDLAPLSRMIDELTVVHRFDQRGCGGSDPSTRHSIDRYCADIDALRVHWHHEKMIVIGHSFGATLALAYAMTHPQRVTSVGYVSGVGIGSWKEQYRRRRDELMTAQQVERLRALKALENRSPDEEIEFRALAWFTDHADQQRAWIWAHEDARAPYPINQYANRVLNAEADAWTATTLPQQAASLEIDTVFIHGSHDPRSFTSAQELSTLMPRARMEIIDGAGHCIWRERPENLRTVLTDLVTGTAV